MVPEADVHLVGLGTKALVWPGEDQLLLLLRQRLLLIHVPLLSDPFFPLSLVAKDRVEKDCLGDLLRESVRYWAG